MWGGKSCILFQIFKADLIRYIEGETSNQLLV